MQVEEEGGRRGADEGTRPVHSSLGNQPAALQCSTLGVVGVRARVYWWRLYSDCATSLEVLGHRA